MASLNVKKLEELKVEDKTISRFRVEADDGRVLNADVYKNGLSTYWGCAVKLQSLLDVADEFLKHDEKPSPAEIAVYFRNLGAKGRGEAVLDFSDVSYPVSNSVRGVLKDKAVGVDLVTFCSIKNQHAHIWGEVESEMSPAATFGVVLRADLVGALPNLFLRTLKESARPSSVPYVDTKELEGVIRELYLGKHGRGTYELQ